MLDRFKGSYGRIQQYLGRATHDDLPAGDDAGIDADADAEAHEAVLELLIATMFADRTVTEAELAEIERYGADQGWNTAAFSFGQAMGSATSTVRAARDQPGGLDALLASASRRITSADLRHEVPLACQQVAAADGATDEEESAWLASVAAAFRT